MKILSHRGYWKSVDEKNTEAAFCRSFSLGFGTETDVRDLCGKLVISHDIPDEIAMPFSRFLAIAGQSGHPLTLALNIKADGLVDVLKSHLDSHPGLDCFVFDMAVPDMRAYLQAGVPVFTRMSEVEQHPIWLEQAAGIWLDGFGSEWYEMSQIQALLETGKRICIVSPELHKRPHLPLWARLREIDYDELMLCTDFPEDAASFFTD